MRGAWLMALAVGLLAVPEAVARGGRGGHRGGGHAPRVTAAHRSGKAAPAHKPPKMARAVAPARHNAAKPHVPQARGNVHPGANRAKAGANASATSAHHVAAGAPRPATAAGVNPSRPAASAGVAPTRSAVTNPYAYTYGAGAGARRYRAYGYGHGYRNRYYGGRYGYGRSQGNGRAIVSRLRAVHAGLARLDHDYQGHRARAMHAVSMAIRQLSHRSMVYRGTGFASARAGNRAPGGRRGRPMSQAQSDARMGQALRTLQGVAMQLAGQGTNTSGHARARGHVQSAIRELNIALAIR